MEEFREQSEVQARTYVPAALEEIYLEYVTEATVDGGSAGGGDIGGETWNLAR